MFSFHVKVTQAEWLKHPEARWNAGLVAAGLNFKQSVSRSHYPPLPVGGHRTYATADKADFTIVETGRRMEFGSTFYFPFILGGTKKWEGWPGFGGDIVDAMIAGFIAGVRDYAG